MRRWIKKGRRREGEKREREWYGKTEQQRRRSGVNQYNARSCKGPWLGCVWSVSFKGGTAGRAITDDLPLPAGPGATLTESNHKQVNSTSTFLIFFSPVSFFWSRSVYLDETLLFLLPPPPPPFSLFWKRKKSQVYFQWLFQTTYTFTASALKSWRVCLIICISVMVHLCLCCDHKARIQAKCNVSVNVRWDQSIFSGNWCSETFVLQGVKRHKLSFFWVHVCVKMTSRKYAA